MTRWRVVVGVGAAAAVVLGVGVWAIWLRPGHGDRTLPPIRARVYTSKRACLLTGAQGLAEPGAQLIWAGMERASTAHRIQVSYLAVAGQQTEANAATYVGTLVQQRCGVIFVTGEPEVAAMVADLSKLAGIEVAVAGTKPVATGLTHLPIAPVSATENAADMLVSQLADR